MTPFSDSLAITFTIYRADSYTKKFTYTASETRSESYGDTETSDVPYADPCPFGILFAHGIAFYLRS